MANELSFLNQNNFQTYNRSVAKHCKSVNASIMLSELVNRQDMHANNNELASHEKYGEGWFYYTADKAEERTCLSRKEQDTGIKILKKLDLIESVVFGMPGKRYFRLNIDKILEVFGLSKSKSSLSQKAKLDSPKRRNKNCPKGETAHIYKEPNEDPYEEPLQQQQEVADAVVHNSDFYEKESINSLHIYLSNRDREWGIQWRIPLSTIQSLVSKHGLLYVTAQINGMIVKQTQGIKDKDSNKMKAKIIEKPESYLQMSCKNNYAEFNISRK